MRVFVLASIVDGTAGDTIDLDDEVAELYIKANYVMKAEDGAKPEKQTKPKRSPAPLKG